MSARIVPQLASGHAVHFFSPPSSSLSPLLDYTHRLTSPISPSRDSHRWRNAFSFLPALRFVLPASGGPSPTSASAAPSASAALRIRQQSALHRALFLVGTGQN